MAMESWSSVKRQLVKRKAWGRSVDLPMGGTWNCITELSQPASDSQKPRTYPRPGPEGLAQFPYLILPQGSHLPRVPAAPGIQQMKSSLETQAHHLLGPELEAASPEGSWLQFPVLRHPVSTEC